MQRVQTSSDAPREVEKILSRKAGTKEPCCYAVPVVKTHPHLHPCISHSTYQDEIEAAPMGTTLEMGHGWGQHTEGKGGSAAVGTMG